MELRERITAKAHDLFHRLGIRRVTMDDIATQLGISKKTIYQVFADKDELVEAITSEHVSRNSERCEMDKTKAENAIHEIFLTIDIMEEMFVSLNPTVIYDLEKFHPRSFQKFNRFKNDYLRKIVEENLAWGIKEGLYRQEINKDVITQLRLNTIFFPFNQDIFPQNKYNLTEVQIEILNHFVYGVATVKGLSMIEKYKQQKNLKTNS